MSSRIIELAEDLNLLIIRSEIPEDVDAIYRVNEQAFGQKSEAMLVDKLRNRGVLSISLVAV